MLQQSDEERLGVILASPYLSRMLNKIVDYLIQEDLMGVMLFLGGLFFVSSLGILSITLAGIVTKLACR